MRGEGVGPASLSRPAVAGGDRAPTPGALAAAAVAAAPTAVVVVDAAGRVLLWNPRASEVFGHAPDEVLGRSVFDLAVPPHVRAATEPRLLEFAARPGVVGQRREVEVPLRRRDGTEFAARVVVAPVAGPDGVALACFLEDLTAARAAQAAVREGERRLRQIIDLVPHFVFAKDVEGRFVLVNEAVARAYGTTVDGLLGRRDADFNPNAAEVARFLEDDLAVIRSGQPRRIEDEVLTDAAGGVRVLETVKIPFLLDDHGTPAVLGVSTDVTDRRRVEAELLEAQKMEGIGRLAGGVAHDFNNLLTAIVGSVQLLEDRLAGDPAGRRELETVRAATDRAAALTKQLLTFARRDQGRPTTVDLPTVLTELDGMLRRVLGAPVELATEAERDAGAVDIDPSQLEQVVVNLVVNARDAMPRGGRITVRARAVAAAEGPAPAVGLAGTGPFVELTVADTGEGLTDAVRARMFEPFFTTKRGGGTGLGLAICYGIVKRAGGHIAVESAPGRGTTFRVLLPRSSRPAAPRPAAPPEPGLPRGAETVLVVDDEDPVRQVMVRTLGGLGYHVLAATGGEEAVDLARGHAGRIDLVVADVVMPGTSGPAAVERILATRPGTRAVFVSGYYDPDRLRDVGVHEVPVLPKPFTPAAFARAVREALDRPRPPPPAP